MVTTPEEALRLGDRSQARRLFRYAWAARVAQEKGLATALDLGCNGGDGAQLLAAVGLRVYGVPYPVAFGQAPVAPGVQLAPADLDAYWAQVVPHAELITCFGVLELRRHRELFLEALRSRVRPGGGVCLSLLDPGRTEVELRPYGARVLYTDAVARRLLSLYFERVTAGESLPAAGYLKEAEAALGCDDLSLGLFYCERALAPGDV